MLTLKKLAEKWREMEDSLQYCIDWAEPLASPKGIKAKDGKTYHVRWYRLREARPDVLKLYIFNYQTDWFSLVMTINKAELMEVLNND